MLVVLVKVYDTLSASVFCSNSPCPVPGACGPSSADANEPSLLLLSKVVTDSARLRCASMPAAVNRFAANTLDIAVCHRFLGDLDDGRT